MNAIKHAWSKFRNLSMKKRIQFAIASVLTVALLISLPVYAWFSYGRKIITIKKIDAPHPLYLSAAHREDEFCFEIDGIDVDEILVDGYGEPIKSDGKEQKITYKDYVFSVTGDAVNKFTIQIAYTTNNPFSYIVYAAEELTEKPTIVHGEPVGFVQYTLQGQPMEGLPELQGEQYHLDVTAPTTLYYRINTSITEGGTGGRYNGIFLNSTDGKKADNDTANNKYLEQAYGSYENIHQDAKPVYWQARGVSAFPGTVNSNKDPFSRHFILRVQWSSDNPPDNASKETDIIYVTVKATS